MDILFSHPAEYPQSTGRNFDGILQVVDSLQLTANYRVSTASDPEHEENVIVVPAISTENTKERFPKGLKIIKPYLRYTPQPDLAA